jgi:hypothetical protein
MSKLTLVTLLVSALLLGMVVSRGGSEEETSTVAARIGSEEIKRSVVDRWVRFESELREAMGLQAGEADEVETHTLESLVQAQWIRREAESRGISKGRDERRAAIAKFESRIGLYPETIEKVRSSLHLDTDAFELRAVADALEEEMVRGKAALPSMPAMRRYYRAHVGELGEPEQRTFSFLLSPSEDGAILGKRELNEGEDWENVAEYYSRPQLLSEIGWRIAEATRADIRELLNPKLADVAFTVPGYEVLGPRSVEGGWAVFEVTEIEPAFRPSFRLVREAVRNQLLRQQRESALSSLERTLREKYADQTRCATDFDIFWCEPL